MNVLSLFDGISCGRIALDRCGVKYDKYFASEIDKFAIKVAQHNYQDTIQLGDVRTVFAKDLPKIGLLIGGSPCQGFSFSGKMLNFDDPRSKLFFEFHRLLKECQPKYFFLENVRMKKESEQVITRLLGVEPVKINSSLVSAQNRYRLYWTNIPRFEIPEDRNILLKDILQDESEVNPKYHMSEKWWKKNEEFQLKKKYSAVNPEKAITMTARQYGNWNGNYLKLSKKGKIKTNQGKASCLTGGGNSGGNHSDMDVLCINPKKADGTQTYQQYRVYDINHKSPAILAGLGRGNIIEDTRRVAAVRGRYIKDGVGQDSKGSTAGKTKQYVEFRQDNKSNCLTTVPKDNVVVPYTLEDRVLAEDFIYRRLTPIECERLQTIPDGYTSVASDTQRYKQLGNGWTVDMICEFFKNIS